MACDDANADLAPIHSTQVVLKLIFLFKKYIFRKIPLFVNWPSLAEPQTEYSLEEQLTKIRPNSHGLMAQLGTMTIHMRVSFLVVVKSYGIR